MSARPTPARLRPAPARGRPQRSCNFVSFPQACQPSPAAASQKAAKMQPPTKQPLLQRPSQAASRAMHKQCKPWSPKPGLHRRPPPRGCLFLIWLAAAGAAAAAATAAALEPQAGPGQLAAALEQPPAAFFAPPEALLAYLEPAGSGDGAFKHHRPGELANQLASSSSSSSSYSSSSSVSPALITAKCWNNYADDNDCAQLNVISQQSPQLAQASNQEAGEALITPVVVFESSAPVAPDDRQQSVTSSPDDTHLVTPYYYATAATPPEANQGPQRRPQPASSPSSSSSSSSSSFAGSPTARPGSPTPPTQSPPPMSGFVATPQPKRKHKTTTIGRKCANDNDADCDEPDEGSDEGSEADSDSSGEPPAASPDNPELGSGAGPSAPDDNESEPSGQSGAGSALVTDDDDGDDSTGNTNANQNNNNNNNNASEEPDAELDRPASSPSSLPDSQAASSSPASTVIPSSSTEPAASRPAAEIEVVVHSTLPATFTSLSPLGRPGSSGSNSNSATEPADASTMMPDDTYKSRPVFPASSSSEASSAEGGPQASGELDSSTPANPVTDDDLYTFRPIPMQPAELGPASRQGRVRPGAGANQSATDQTTPSASTSTSGDERRPPEQESANKWFGNRNSHDQQHQAQHPLAPLNNPWRTFRPSPTLSQPDEASGSRPNSGLAQLQPSPSVNQSGRPASQSDLLPTMLLYASIIILATTALIFVLMAFGLWRRNVARQRALYAHKTNLLAGNQMVASLSHASQLMATAGLNVGLGAGQQALYAQRMLANGSKPANNPLLGLASNQMAPANGAKVGHGAPSAAAHGRLEQSQDDEEHSRRSRPILEEDERSEADLRPQQANQAGGQRGQLANNGSWSASDEQSSTGSSQQSQISQVNNNHNNNINNNNNNNMNHNSSMPPTTNVAQMKPQYPNNGLMVGHQNSSSLSDSQGSPDHHRAMAAPRGPQMGPGQPQLMAGPAQQQGPPAPPVHQQQVHDYYNPGAGQLQASAGYPQLAAYGPNDPTRDPLGPLGPMGPMRPPDGPLSAPHSRSVENLAAVYQPASHGGPFRPRPTHNFGPGQQQHMGPAEQQLQHHPHFEPVHPARVAMNPLATLGRRCPPGSSAVGQLSRGLYSEDSSSLMTASPSLARTSSSSSFAFNNNNINNSNNTISHLGRPQLHGHQQQGPPPVMPKPVIDAAGRLVNDYTASFGPGPPILGRKDRSEAWYV